MSKGMNRYPTRLGTIKFRILRKLLPRTFGVIETATNSDGVNDLAVSNINFIAVNVYEDENGYFVVSPAGATIPDSARRVYCRTKPKT